MVIELTPPLPTAIKAELAKLQPAIPWAHHFDLHGVETVTREENEQFYKKAQA